jgi:hypothetical protein
MDDLVGLYYYGARFYDPYHNHIDLPAQLAIWDTTDITQADAHVGDVSLKGKNAVFHLLVLDPG